MAYGGYQPEGKDCTVIMLMDWRHEKEQQGNKIAARAIQRLIDARMSKASMYTRASAFLYEEKTGIKVDGW
jgi:hypothetical protein